MRMWNVNPRFMCREHLLGEHLELHMLANSLRQGARVRPLVAHGLVEPYNVQGRHALVAAEMAARGYAHRTPMDAVQLAEPMPEGHVCEVVGSAELPRRCEACRALQAVEPYEYLQPPHACDAACAERVRRDLADRPAVPHGRARRRPASRVKPPTAGASA